VDRTAHWRSSQPASSRLTASDGWFFEAGLNVPEVALISGHCDPRMLFRYTHPRPELVAEKLAKAADKVEDDTKDRL
jgi:hypothetical protein